MNLRHLTFRLLQVFVAVVQSRSITQTAKQLHLTQPTVSLQLKRLQEAVGEPLLYQDRQQLHITDAGWELYRLCQEMFGRFDDYSGFLTELRGGQRGQFRIAMVNTAQYILPKLLGPFSQSQPNVAVTVEIGNREQVLDRFERGEDDIYVFSHPPTLEHASAARFLKNPLVMIAQADHPLADKHHIPLDDLKNERFLLREPGSATRMLFDSFIQQHGLTLNRSQQMASNEAIQVAVASGMGVAVLSRHVLANTMPGLCTLDVQGLPLDSHWYFVIRHDRYLSHAAISFLRFAMTNLPHYLDPQWVRNDLASLLDKVVDQRVSR